MRFKSTTLRRWLPAVFLTVFLGGAWAPLALAAEKAPETRQAAAGFGWSWLGIAMATIGVAVAVTLAWATRRFLLRRRQANRSDPWKLLRELCQIHGLSRRAERLLRRAAYELDTPHPARFFLEPKLLLEAQKRDSLRGSRRALVLLYEQLFGEDV